MRTSTLITGAALAASAFAGPLFRRDDVVVEVVNTVTDVAYATVIVTQTDVSGPAPTPNEPAAPPAPPAETTSASHYGHRLSWSRPSDEAPAQPEVTVVTVTAQEGSTSAWTSSWASTWVVTPSAVATTTAAPAATTQVSLLESFHHLLSRNSLHARINFESLMAQMFRPTPTSSSQIKRATSSIRKISTVTIYRPARKTTVTLKPTSSIKTSSSSVKVISTVKGTPVAVSKLVSTIPKPKVTSSVNKTSSTQKVSSPSLSTPLARKIATVPHKACKRESAIATPIKSIASSSSSSLTLSSSNPVKPPSSFTKPPSTTLNTSTKPSLSSAQMLSTSPRSSSTTTPFLHFSKMSSSTSNAKSSIQVTQAAAAPAGKATTYQERVLAHHNVHRANHSASALVWDDALANTAAIIASTCIYAHSMNVNGGGYGQNIAAGVEANNVSAVITELFYNGEVGYYNNLYGQASPDMSQFEKWGHFSQLVWKGTTKVGCATQYCSGGLANTGQYVAPHFTVCNYGNPGESPP
jgi:uncharacterized protein YkwD